MDPQQLRDTVEGLLADLAQVWTAMLILSPDSGTIDVPRAWLAKWLRDVSTILTVLRAQRPPQTP
jgi:hypothetical protein